MYKLILTGIFCIFLTGLTANVLGKPGIPYSKSIYSQGKVINADNFSDYIVHVKENDRNVKRIVEVIFKYSRIYNIDPLTLMVVINTESHFKNNAKGLAGEVGLGQVTPSIWLDEKTFGNLYKAGIIEKGKERQLKWIGRNVESTAHILNVKRTECFNLHARGILKQRGYKTPQECMIRRYNGRKKMSRKYYVKVTSNIGQYYYFVQKTNAKYFISRL